MLAPPIIPKNIPIISLFLIFLSVIGHIAESGKIDIPVLGTLTFHACLATFAVFGPGLGILVSGLRSAKNFSPTMDTLVGIGVFSAYFSSLSSGFGQDVKGLENLRKQNFKKILRIILHKLD